MVQPIIIRYRWTADDWLTSQHYHFHDICRPIYRFGLNFISAMIFLGGCGYLASGSVFIGICFFIISIYWFFIRKFEFRRAAYRRFGKPSNSNVEMEWEITSEQVIMRNSVSYREDAWRMFKRMAVTPKGVLLYYHTLTFIWLPLHGFSSEADFERFLEFAKRKISKIYRVN